MDRHGKEREDPVCVAWYTTRLENRISDVPDGRECRHAMRTMPGFPGRGRALLRRPCKSASPRRKAVWAGRTAARPFLWGVPSGMPGTAGIPEGPPSRGYGRNGGHPLPEPVPEREQGRASGRASCRKKIPEGCPESRADEVLAETARLALVLRLPALPADWSDHPERRGRGPVHAFPGSGYGKGAGGNLE